MTDKTILTQSGYDDLKSELNWRLNDERKKIADEIERARQQGDLSENASYKAAMENKEFNEVKIKQLGDLIQNSEIVKKNEHTSVVQIGSIVSIKEKDKNNERTFTIVSENEADPTQNKISFKSPLALVLMGKGVGKEVKFNTAITQTVYIILSIK